MGEAKRRGTREQRVAEGTARREAWEKQQAEERARLLAERRRLAAKLRQAAAEREVDREAAGRVLTVGGSDRHIRSIALAAALSGALIVDPTRRKA